MERSGTIVLLKELYSDPGVVGKYVRVTGTATSVNTMTNIVEITHDHVLLNVDVSLVDIGTLKLDTLVQFIGEMHARSDGIANQDDLKLLNAKGRHAPQQSQLFLSARIFRVVEGLDLRLFEETLLARRDFLNSERSM
jgi:hypothetical protein